MATDYAGIDYGLGQSNIYTATGIRYGVISQHSVMLEALDDLEPYYGTPHCPKCGNDAIDIAKITEDTESWEYAKYDCDDYGCPDCQYVFGSESAFPDESQGFTYDQGGYKLTNCLDSDIFVLASPYYTYAQYCSPCVPGAGNLNNPCEGGPKTYCLGHDWFEDSKAPYPVYRVSDDAEVIPDTTCAYYGKSIWKDTDGW